MKDEEVEDILRHIIAVTGETYIERKRLFPQFYLVGKVLLPIVSAGVDKEMFAEFVRYQAKLLQPRAIISTCEAWLVEGSILPPNMKPSQHPKAVEGLYVALEDIRLGIRMYFGKTRNHGKRVSHEPIVELRAPNGERPNRWEGTFTGLLSPENAN